MLNKYGENRRIQGKRSMNEPQPSNQNDPEDDLVTFQGHPPGVSQTNNQEDDCDEPDEAA
jgi:hypothetical protein